MLIASNVKKCKNTTELIFQKGLILVKQIYKKSDICHYWCFEDIGFKYEPYLCNGCHDLREVLTEFIFGI